MAPVPELIKVDGTDLRWGDRRAPLSAVTALHERYDPWAGRGSLDLHGLGWSVPMGLGYGEMRASLRQALPDVPMSSDWMDGRFPSVAFGVRSNVVLLLSILAAAAVAGFIAVSLGWPAGLAAAGLAMWPLGRLRDAWVVRAEGLRGGPPWATLEPWDAVTEVVVRRGAQVSEVWTRGPGGGHRAALPTALIPAFRARIRRLGGLELREAASNLDDVYARWSRPAVGIPWGIGVGSLLGAGATPDPLLVL